MQSRPLQALPPVQAPGLPAGPAPQLHPSAALSDLLGSPSLLPALTTAPSWLQSRQGLACSLAICSLTPLLSLVSGEEPPASH